VKGFETEVSLFPLPELMINVSAGYNEFKGDETDTTRPTYRHPSALLQPEWNLSAGAQYGLRLGNGGTITPRFDWYYQSERTNGTASLPQRDPDDINPGYPLLNARIAYEPASGDWQIALNVQNALDREYWQQLGTATQRNGAAAVARVGTPGRPREWALTFRKNFGINP
jgi:iron complex outermembrane receptor protein